MGSRRIGTRTNFWVFAWLFAAGALAVSPAFGKASEEARSLDAKINMDKEFASAEAAVLRKQYRAVLKVLPVGFLRGLQEIKRLAAYKQCPAIYRSNNTAGKCPVEEGIGVAGGTAVLDYVADEFKASVAESPHYYAGTNEWERALVHTFAHYVAEVHPKLLVAFSAIHASSAIDNFANLSYLSKIAPRGKSVLGKLFEYHNLYRQQGLPRRFPTDFFAATGAREYFAVAVEMYVYDYDTLKATLQPAEISWLKRLFDGDFFEASTTAKSASKAKEIRAKDLEKMSKYDLTEGMLAKLAYHGKISDGTKRDYEKYLRQLFGKTSEAFLRAIFDTKEIAVYDQCPPALLNADGQCSSQMHILPSAGIVYIVAKDLPKFFTDNLHFYASSDFAADFQAGMFHEFCHYLHYKYEDTINGFLAIRGKASIDGLARDISNNHDPKQGTAKISWETYFRHFRRYGFPMRSKVDIHAASNVNEYWAVSAEMYFFHRRALENSVSKEELTWLKKFAHIIGQR